MLECKHERYSLNVIGFEVMQKSKCVCGDCGIVWESLSTRKPQKEVAQSSAMHNSIHSEISAIANELVLENPHSDYVYSRSDIAGKMRKLSEM